MRLNTIIMGSLMACCAGCVGEKVVYVPVIRDDGRSKKSVDCLARLVKSFGIDNNYFANTNRFDVKMTGRTSHAVKLEKPFGPFDSIVVKLTDDAPAVVDVSNDDRSFVTNGMHRLWLEEIELSHEYRDKDSAAHVLDDFSGIIDHLNSILDSDLDQPRWPAVIDKTAAESRRKGQKTYPYLTESGERPKISATYNLVEQRITLEAEEGLYAKRGDDAVLLVPPQIRMSIKFTGVSVGLCEEDFAEEIAAVSLGAPIAKRLTFGKKQRGWFGFDRGGGRPRYEYNVDTKRIMAVPAEHENAEKMPNVFRLQRLSNSAKKAP